MNTNSYNAYMQRVKAQAQSIISTMLVGITVEDVDLPIASLVADENLERDAKVAARSAIERHLYEKERR